MSKFIKENSAVLLLALLILVVVCIVIFKPKDKDDVKYDLSKVKIIDVEQAVKLYADIEPHVYVIGREGCSACETFIPAVNELIDQYGIDIYYIDLLQMDRESEEYKQFISLLNYRTEYDGKKGTMEHGIFLLKEKRV